jgi:hypothetical protein
MVMAKRNRNAMTMKKPDPSVMRMRFSIPGFDGVGLPNPKYIDISQCASIVNRRFYRQGLNWAVGGFRIAGGSGGQVYISKLQNTWVTSGAWHKSQALWLKQQNDALAKSVSGETAARFRDFKIHANAQHSTNTFANNLTPLADNPFVNLAYPLGEWLESRIVVPNDGAPGVTTEYKLMMHGPDVGLTKGMIEGYALSRNRPTSPDPTTPNISNSWMQEMFDVGDDSTEITNNAQYENNELPYDQVDYPGGASNSPGMECHRIIEFSATNTTGTTWINVAGTNFPCGIIEIVNSNPQLLGLEVLLVPGNHRGYLAEPMQDM